MAVDSAEEGGLLRWVHADLLDVTAHESLLREAGATHLLHLAWYAEHGKFWQAAVNLEWATASAHLVRAFCGAGGERVVVAGTCAEYDPSYGVCRESTTPLVPHTHYGVCKDATRRLVASLCEQKQLSWAWGRIFLLYGRGEVPSRLVPALAAALQGQRPAFSIDSSAYRDFLQVSDVAEALVSLLQASTSGAFNISSHQPVQLSDLVKLLAAQLRADPEPILKLAAVRPGEPRLLVGDNSALQALGWHPAVSLAAGLADAVGGLRQAVNVAPLNVMEPN